MEWKRYMVGTLTIALLISVGFNVAPDDTHFCRNLEITNKCDHLSSTEKTCYPREDTTKGKKYCSSGWEPLLKALVEDKIETESRYSSKKYRCNQGECVPLI